MINYPFSNLGSNDCVVLKTPSFRMQNPMRCEYSYMFDHAEAYPLVNWWPLMQPTQTGLSRSGIRHSPEFGNRIDRDSRGLNRDM